VKDLNKKVEEQSELIFEWESKFQDLEQKYD
jgi:predicted  nucleic acid-binding Zn-ribbon protein